MDNDDDDDDDGDDDNKLRTEYLMWMKCAPHRKLDVFFIELYNKCSLKTAYIVCVFEQPTVQQTQSKHKNLYSTSATCFIQYCHHIVGNNKYTQLLSLLFYSCNQPGGDHIGRNM